MVTKNKTSITGKRHWVLSDGIFQDFRHFRHRNRQFRHRPLIQRDKFVFSRTDSMEGYTR